MPVALLTIFMNLPERGEFFAAGCDEHGKHQGQRAGFCEAEQLCNRARKALSMCCISLVDVDGATAQDIQGTVIGSVARFDS